MVAHALKIGLLAVVIGAFSSGCSSGREVEITGEVTAPSTSAGGSILLEIYDVQQVDDTEELTRVHSVTFDAPGPFSEKATVEGDQLIVRAIADGDDDGACSSGEAWREIQLAIDEEDRVGPAILALESVACPTGDH